MGTLDVVVGGQFGSEGKGHVTQRLTERRIKEGRPTLVVRVAGPNAGHSVVVDGQKYAMRQVPVGFAAEGREKWRATLAIAAGSEIDLPVLLKEIGLLRQAGLLEAGDLWVDPEATLIEERHKEIEADSALTERLGSTAKGIGAARADRVMRVARTLGSEPEAVRALVALGVHVKNTGQVIYDHSYGHAAIVIEGTQGFGLGQHAGYYPYCTSSDCRAIDFLAMAGITPWEVDAGGFRVWVTLRPFPIRVAGDSGPLANETTWEKLGLPEEKTTVTQKVRRVGLWDAGLAAAAVWANGGGVSGARPVSAAFTMMDQVFPGLHGVEADRAAGELWELAMKWVAVREGEIGAHVDLVTTSDRTAVWLR